MADYRLWVNEERTVLVRLWLEPGQVEVATRETADHTWGAPVYCTEERTFTREPPGETE